jgi:hypothetical protein
LGFAALAAAGSSATLPLYVFAAVMGLSALALGVMAPLPATKPREN